MYKDKSVHVKHWDSVGNPSLDFFALREYFRNDMASMLVLGRSLPHMFIVHPGVKVVIEKGCATCLVERWTITGAVFQQVYPLKKRSKRYFWEIIQGKHCGWSVRVVGGGWILEHKPFLTDEKRGFFPFVRVAR